MEELVDQDECNTTVYPTKTETKKVDKHQSTKRFVRTLNLQTSVNLLVEIQTLDTHEKVDVKGLLDSGATAMFIDKEFVKGNRLQTRKLPRKIPVYNVDGTPNEGGSIEEEVTLMMTYQGHKERATFEVCNLGKTAMIIGHSWLKKHNPEIDWIKGEVVMTRCPKGCGHDIKMRRRAKVREQVNYIRDGPDGDETDFVDPTPWIRWHEIKAMTPQYDNPEKKPDLMKQIPSWITENRHVFDKKESQRLPMRREWDHAIDLKEGFKPQNPKIYPLSPKEQKELDEFLEEQLSKGYIKPSKSPQAAPFFFVGKKDGTNRPVQDYRYLNQWTVRNNYPLPLIPELIDKLKGSKIFTKLDLRWGFNNVRIKEGDEWKAAFKTNRGMYEPTVMYFGLVNSPATFQTMMNHILRPLIDQGHVIVYMDDILIFTDTVEEGRHITKEVLRLLAENDLFLKPEKCFFELRELEYLGMIVSADGVKMDKGKVDGIMSWPIPTKVKELQSFLGFANFYRRFIKGFSEITRPLHRLTKKDTPWLWSTEEQKAFDTLKERFTTAPILCYPDPEKKLKIEADASGYASGAVLSQLEDDGKWHPCAYISKGFNETERNYDIHDREMLAIMRAFEEWRHHLSGAKHTVEVWTDHKNLEYFMTTKKLNRRQARWSLILSGFNFILRHKPGKSMTKPDGLSRRPDHETGVHDNQDMTLLKPEFFAARGMTQGHVLIEDSEKELLSEIRKNKALDESVAKAVEEMKRSPNRRLRSDEWTEEQGLLMFRGKVYIPKNEQLRRKIVALYHDSEIAGHPGRWKTMELVTRNYWWPNMARFIATYIQGCDKCNRSKTFPNAPAGKLMPNPIPKEPWTDISVDLIVKLPFSQGHDSILVVVDRYSKMIHLVPCSETLSSLGLAALYRDHIWKLHGLPNTVISDRGPQFASSLMKELHALLGVKTNLSTAYHPQTDGQTERVNQEVEQYLRLFINHRQDNWADWLAIAEFAINNRVSTSTQSSPFYLNYGRNPRMGFEPLRHTKTEAAGDFAERMRKVREEAESALKKAADEMKRFADQGLTESPTYNVGDRVWLDTSNMATNQPTKKLANKRDGPFTVTKVISKNAYQLKLPRRYNNVHPVFNVSKLLPYIEPQIPGQKSTPPPPIEVEGEVEYEVEEILDSKLVRGKLQYLVKWKGYTDEHNSWEPETNVKHSKKLLTEFHKQNPSAPRRISTIDFSTLRFHPMVTFTDPIVTEESIQNSKSIPLFSVNVHPQKPRIHEHESEEKKEEDEGKVFAHIEEVESEDDEDEIWEDANESFGDDEPTLSHATRQFPKPSHS